MPVPQLFRPLFPAAVHCGTLQGARDKYFLDLLVVHSVDRVCSQKQRAPKKDRAALVPLALWSRAMSQILSHDSLEGIPDPVMCLRD